jgi:hypothetical protein
MLTRKRPLQLPLRSSPHAAARARAPFRCRAQLGLLYTSCDGSTRRVAALLQEQLGEIVSSPIDLSLTDPRALAASQFEGVVVGSPTYNTDATAQRTGTCLDDHLYNGGLEGLQLQVRAPTGGAPCLALHHWPAAAPHHNPPPRPAAYSAASLQGKPFAVFGCGDAAGYRSNFADAIAEVGGACQAARPFPPPDPAPCWRCPPDGAPPAASQVHDALAGLGGVPLGYARPEGYLHRASKSLRGGLFLGLPIDEVSQPELTGGRVAAWCAQLRQELRQLGAGAAAAAPCHCRARPPPAGALPPLALPGQGGRGAPAAVAELCPPCARAHVRRRQLGLHGGRAWLGPHPPTHPFPLPPLPRSRSGPRQQRRPAAAAPGAAAAGRGGPRPPAAAAAAAAAAGGLGDLHQLQLPGGLAEGRRVQG